MIMSDNIARVAVIGTGTIGASWAAHFLARGLDVTATDPAPDAELQLRRSVDRAWPVVSRLGLQPGASRLRLRFTPDLPVAVQGSDFVQENGPESKEFKVKLFADLDALAAPGVILASSSSGIMMSDIQSKCAHPERCVIGHPFNPPHLIPLVEVVGGKRTSTEAIARAVKFYTDVGKRAIHVRKEVVGHVANRLQAALWREAVHLVAEGVISVADVDAAVSWGPGLRWGVMGPNLLFHLGGGRGGIQHFIEHLSGPFTLWWADLGHPQLGPELKETIVQGVLAEAAGHSVEELEAQRDRVLLGLLALRREAMREAPQPGEDLAGPCEDRHGEA
jgi:3-hydroxyacyl-CoA dehydrogenase